MHVFHYIKRGVKTVYLYGFQRIIPLLFFEALYGLRFSSETSKVVSHYELFKNDPEAKECKYYVPCPYYLAHQAFRLIKDEISNGTFIDYGCGLGRVLLYASRYDFRKIIGIEISESLQSGAQKILSGHFSQIGSNGTEWAVINEDARSFRIPDDTTIFFFNDPFHDVILSSVADRIIDSLTVNPRTIRIIYVNPEYPDIFDTKGFELLHSDVNKHQRGLLIYAGPQLSGQ